MESKKGRFLESCDQTRKDKDRRGKSESSVELASSEDGSRGTKVLRTGKLL